MTTDESARDHDSAAVDEPERVDDSAGVADPAQEQDPAGADSAQTQEPAVDDAAHPQDSAVDDSARDDGPVAQGTQQRILQLQDKTFTWFRTLVVCGFRLFRETSTRLT